MYNIPLHIVHPKDGEFLSPSLRNHDAPALPDYFQRELLMIGGRNRFGGPRLRIVWMQREFRVGAGMQLMRYPAQRWAGNGEIYEVGFPRFMVEQWVDPIFCDLEHWNVEMQGPKPIHGLYRDLMCIQTADGQFCYPSTIHLDELKAMDYRRRHDALGGRDDEEIPERISQYKLSKLTADKQARREYRRNDRRVAIKAAFKERQRRICHLHPNEGRRPDPWVESQKLKAS